MDCGRRLFNFPVVSDGGTTVLVSRNAFANAAADVTTLLQNGRELGDERLDHLLRFSRALLLHLKKHGDRASVQNTLTCTEKLPKTVLDALKSTCSCKYTGRTKIEQPKCESCCYSTYTLE